MLSHVQKWGNSLALRIPSVIAKEIHINNGSEVELIMEKGRIIIFPKKRKKPTLKKLLSQVTKDNIHSETDFGGPIGKEIW